MLDLQTSSNVSVVSWTSIKTVSVFISIPCGSGIFKDASFLTANNLLSDNVPGILLANASEPFTMLSRNWILDRELEQSAEV